MKRIILIAAACAALASCTKAETEIVNTTEPSGAVAFEKGQTVTLTVSAGEQTKVSSELVSSGEDKDKVNFKWEEGDKILVKVGEATAEFTLVTGAGEASATFAGTMPEFGDTFDVQYPVTDPDIATQNYSSTEAIPHDKMKMAATGCTLGNSFTLTPQNAALRLNLYGLNREVRSIVVTNTTAYPNVSYTLNCSTAVRVSKSAETATPFLLVVPAGASGWEFKVEVTAGNATTNPDAVPTYTEGGYTGNGIVITMGTFSTSSKKTFVAGQILNMPAVSLTTVWAPVNCGYDATNYPMGLLYQWGRKYGQAYETGYIEPTSMSKSDDTEKNKENFGYDAYSYNWFSGDFDKTLWNGGTKGAKDPCPEGWRVPTIPELDKLIGGDGTGGEYSVYGIAWDIENKGFWFNGTDSPSLGDGLFLPAAGKRDQNGYVNVIDSHGYYWSSSDFGNFAAWRVHCSTYDNTARMFREFSSFGFSVRCVHE